MKISVQIVRLIQIAPKYHTNKSLVSSNCFLHAFILSKALFKAFYFALDVFSEISLSIPQIFSAFSIFIPHVRLQVCHKIDIAVSKLKLSSDMFSVTVNCTH